MGDMIYTTKLLHDKDCHLQEWPKTRNLMGFTGCAQLPSHVYSNDLAQRFSNHVEKKLSDIRQSIAERVGVRPYAMAAVSVVTLVSVVFS